MSEENPVSITATGGSGKKEISYDEKSGRFFETGTESAECIPNDEYCVVDKASGKMVRLTVQEKERIFLDSLQVSLPGKGFTFAAECQFGGGVKSEGKYPLKLHFP